MSKESNKISCPNCGEEIDVNEILYHQLDGELKKKYNDKIAKERKDLESKEEELKAAKEAIEKANEDYKERVSSAIKSGVKEELAKLEQSLKEQAKEEQEERIAALRKELEEKSEQVKVLNKFKADIERLKREKGELKDKIELEA